MKPKLGENLWWRFAKPFAPNKERMQAILRDLINSGQMTVPQLAGLLATPPLDRLDPLARDVHPAIETVLAQAQGRADGFERSPLGFRPPHQADNAFRTLARLGSPHEWAAEVDRVTLVAPQITDPTVSHAQSALQAAGQCISPQNATQPPSRMANRPTWIRMTAN